MVKLLHYEDKELSGKYENLGRLIVGIKAISVFLFEDGSCASCALSAGCVSGCNEALIGVDFMSSLKRGRPLRCCG